MTISINDFNDSLTFQKTEIKCDLLLACIIWISVFVDLYL